MRHRFFTCDVFTDVRFGGNPLAVLPDAQGLSDAQMQQIAREFNYSETTFVLPPEQGHTRRVRIFTPHDELPFAGHPNIGTAFVLAASGELGSAKEVAFEEGAGLVRIGIQAGDPIRCELEAPEALSLGAPVHLSRLADVLSLNSSDFVSEVHPPQTASVGLRFLFAQLRDQKALSRVRVNPGAIDAFKTDDLELAIHVYVRAGSEIRARVLIAEGGYEDPATGSANCALAAMLSQMDAKPEGDFAYQVTQGVEMGRPSTLYARASKRDGNVTAAHIAGTSVMVSEGALEV